VRIRGTARHTLRSAPRWPSVGRVVRVRRDHQIEPFLKVKRYSIVERHEVEPRDVLTTSCDVRLGPTLVNDRRVGLDSQATQARIVENDDLTIDVPDQIGHGQSDFSRKRLLNRWFSAVIRPGPLEGRALAPHSFEIVACHDHGQKLPEVWFS
jgi:hypothetical protein